MKIKKVKKSYSEVLSAPSPKQKKPKKPNILFRTVLKVASLPDLIFTSFRLKKNGMERLSKNEPSLYLMNHSSFIDLEIAASVLYPRPFNIVCTSDGFIGKNWLMRQIGCIPTKKFIFDMALVRELVYTLKTLKSSVLMYPEASYSFDGRATVLPESLGKFVKLLGVPVVMIETHGAFLRDPLYNNLQKRKVKVEAEMTYLLSPEEIKEKTADEINAVLKDSFSFDNFRYQQEKGIKVKEKFRADFLNRTLYRCPHCNTEGKTEGRGTELICKECGAAYELTEDGRLERKNGEAAFTHIPDWFDWQRDCVRKELLNGSYKLDVEVGICLLKDTKCIYEVGEGRLTHTAEGFKLTGCNGEIDYSQTPLSSYSLYSDFYWYEIGDVISIGDHKMLYYCFPKNCGDVVAKTRLATEELYKICKEKVKM